MTDLSDLISRVRSATGPDRELDAEIMFDLFATPVGRKYDGGPMGYLWPEDNPSWSFGIRFPGKDRTWFKDVRKRIDGETLVIERDGANVLMNALRIPKLTASLDAAIELCERVLPNARIKMAIRARARSRCERPNHAEMAIRRRASAGRAGGRSPAPLRRAHWDAQRFAGQPHRCGSHNPLKRKKPAPARSRGGQIHCCLGRGLNFRSAFPGDPLPRRSRAGMSPQPTIPSHAA